MDVFEASDAVGGLARSAQQWEWRVDFGSHVVVPSDPFTCEVWSEFVGTRGVRIAQRRAIVIAGRVYDYPLRAKALLRSLGVFDAMRAGASLLAARMLPTKHDQSAEDWVTNRYGRFLFDRVFRGYAEKYIGLPAREIAASFARNLIGDRSAQSLAKRVKQVKKQGSAVASSNRQKDFGHPVEGLSQMWEGMRRAIEGAGGRIHLGTRVDRFEAGSDGVTIHTSAGRTHHDHVLSAMPLGPLLKALPETPASVRDAAAGLRYRATVLVFLRTRTPNPFPYNWIFLYDHDVQAGRVTNFYPWLEVTGQSTSNGLLCLAYWCDRDSPTFTASPGEMLRQAAADLARAGFPVEPVDTNLVHLPVTHAVFDLACADRLKVVNAYLEGFSCLKTMGRQGNFQHNSVAGSMMEGYRAARQFLERFQQDGKAPQATLHV